MHMLYMLYIQGDHLLGTPGDTSDSNCRHRNARDMSSWGSIREKFCLGKLFMTDFMFGATRMHSISCGLVSPVSSILLLEIIVKIFVEYAWTFIHCVQKKNVSPLKILQ